MGIQTPEARLGCVGYQGSEPHKAARHCAQTLSDEISRWYFAGGLPRTG